MTIYVLVEVTYDYYRFQENITANNTGVFGDKFFDFDEWPVLDYEEVSAEIEELNRTELAHYWIQKFKV